MSVGQPQGMLLNEFGDRLRDVFGEVAYHVGSSLNDKTVKWRDVDVRLMLDDDVWEKMSLGNPSNPHRNRKWRALCIVFSDYGRRLTGLPIDFQLQQRSHANAEYGRGKGCNRSALLTVDESEDSMTISVSFSGGVNHGERQVEEAEQAILAGKIADAVKAVLEENAASGSGSVFVGTKTHTFSASSTNSI